MIPPMPKIWVRSEPCLRAPPIKNIPMPVNMASLSAQTMQTAATWFFARPWEMTKMFCAPIATMSESISAAPCKKIPIGKEFKAAPLLIFTFAGGVSHRGIGGIGVSYRRTFGRSARLIIARGNFRREILGACEIFTRSGII